MSEEFAGTLREFVVIETKTGGRDAIAGSAGNYAYAGMAHARVEPLALGVQTQAQALSAMPRWRVTMRKRENIGLHTRLTWRGKYLAVRGVESDPRVPGRMTLNCEQLR